MSNAPRSAIHKFFEQKKFAALFTLCFGCLADAGAADVVQNFQGVVYSDVVSLGTAATPPDTMGAVGLNEYVEFVNGAFSIYSKTGVRQSIISDKQFWTNAGISSSVVNSGISDPRITFDPTVNRWFASEINVSSTGNQVMVARSETSDPSGSWKAVNYTGVSGQFADYDTLAVDAHNIYVGSNNFSSDTGPFSGVTMTVIPKNDILASTPTVANMKQFTQSNAAMGYTPRGVTNYSSDPGHGSIFAVSNTLWKTSNLTAVNGSGSSATLGTTQAISTTYNAANGPVNPTQPGGTQVNVVDDRYSANVVQIGDFIYSTNTVINGSKDAVHWLVVSESTKAKIGEGIITDPNYNFFQPSIDVNANGTFVIGFNRVGSTAGDGNISIFAAIGTTTGNTISVGSPFLLQAGTISNFTGPSYDTGTAKRWGDYSATTVDPTNPNLFWTIQEIPVSATAWGTRIIAISVPEPGSLMMAATAIACLGLVNRFRILRKQG